MTRKIIAIFVALLLTASLCACQNGNDTEDTTGGNNINIGGTTESAGNDTDETNDTEETDSTGGEDTSDNGNEKPEIGDPGEYEYTECNEEVYVNNPGSEVTLRSAEYEAIGLVAHGDKVTRIGYSNDEAHYWSKVIVGDKSGYIASKFLNEINVNEPEGFVEVEKIVYITAATGSMNVRDLPTMNGSVVIGHVQAEEPIKVIAENTTTGWYKIEFVDTNNKTAYGYIASDAGYYVGGEEESSGNENADVTEGYALFNDGAISFEYPKNWEKMTGFDNMMLDATTGSSVNVMIEAYTAEYDMYFTLDNDTFASTFIPVYENAGMQITDYQVSQTTKGDNKVAVISFKNTSDGVAMYQTQYITVVNSEKFYTVTVTEVSPDSTFAEDIYESLTFLG